MGAANHGYHPSVPPATPTPIQKLLALPSLVFLRTVGANAAEHNLPRLSASFSFFAMLSLSPLIVFAVFVAGQFVRDGDKLAEVTRLAVNSAGPQAGDLVQTLAQQSQNPSAGILATVFSILIAFNGASGLFLQLSDALNTIWGIKPDAHPVKAFFQTRLLAFAALLAFGGLLLAWVVLESWMQTAGAAANFHNARDVTTAVGVLFLTFIFAVAYRMFPHKTATWRDVWPGALVAAVGFTICRALLAYYFARAGFTQIYGSAGSLVAVLLWINYSSLVFFLGAEITVEYTKQLGSRRPVAGSAD